MSLLVPVSSVPPAPPALLLEGERTEGRKKREVLHLFRCYTHTHPAGAGTTLKGKRKKKADTNDGQKDKTAQAGEGNRRTSRTNLHGEMDLNSTGHTPKPHNTLQRGTGEELGTDGGLVGEEGKTTRTIKLKGPSSTLDNRALCPKRDRSQIQPHAHKQLFKFHRIRCTICSTSPENQKEKGPHLESVCLPEWWFMRHGYVYLCLISKTEAAVKRFLIVRHGCKHEEM